MEEWAVDGWMDEWMGAIDNYALASLYLRLVVMLNLTNQPRCNHIKVAGIAVAR